MTPLLTLLSFAAPGRAAPEVEGDPAPASAAETAALREELARMREELEALRERPATRVVEDGSGSRTAFGEPVVVSEGEEVAEVVSFGSDVRVAGHVLGDAVSFGGNVRISPTGRVDGDAVSFGGRVEVLDGGSIQGDRIGLGMPEYPSLPTAPAVPMAPAIPEPPVGLGSVLPGTSGLGGLFQVVQRRIVWLLSLSGVGVLVVALFPQRVGRVAQDLEDRPVRAAVVGVLSTGFLLLFSLLFTLLTLGLGLPVSAGLVAVLGGAWVLGFVGLCQVIGDRLPVNFRGGSGDDHQPYGRWLALLVGVLLLTFLGSLPWVGWLVVGFGSTLGIGSALSTRFGRA